MSAAMQQGASVVVDFGRTGDGTMKIHQDTVDSAALTAAQAVAEPSQLLGRLRAVQGADLGPRDRSRRSVLHTAHQRKVKYRTVCVSPVTVVGVP